MTTKFQKGKSGNPKGKPPGTTDKRTELRALLQPHAKELIQKAVDMALEGDPAALRMCLDRICPTIKAAAEPVNAELPTTGSLSEQAAAVYKATVNGEIGTEEAGALMQVLQGQARIVEFSELEGRITALEEHNSSSGGKR